MTRSLTNRNPVFFVFMAMMSMIGTASGQSAGTSSGQKNNSIYSELSRAPAKDVARRNQLESES